MSMKPVFLAEVGALENATIQVYVEYSTPGNYFCMEL